MNLHNHLASIDWRFNYFSKFNPGAEALRITLLRQPIPLATFVYCLVSLDRRTIFRKKRILFNVHDDIPITRMVNIADFQIFSVSDHTTIRLCLAIATGHTVFRILKIIALNPNIYT